MTAYNDLYEPLAKVALPNFQAYCDRHGYDLQVGEYHDRAVTQEDRISRGDLIKAAMYRQLYDKYDVLMWLDLDSIIMNCDIQIEFALAAAGEDKWWMLWRAQELYYSMGGEKEKLQLRNWLWTYNGDSPLSGFWIARTVPIIRRWVERFSFACAYEYGGGDQYAMCQIMNWPPWNDVIVKNCVPAKSAGHCFLPHMVPDGLPQFGAYEPGDWIITFPSLDLATRLEQMQHYAGLAK